MRNRAKTAAGVGRSAISTVYSGLIEEVIFDRLLTYDYLAEPVKPVKLVPMAAESLPEITDGGKTFTFRLRRSAAFGYTENKVDFAQSGFKLKEATGTAYVGYGQGPWYVGGTLGASDLDYRDVHRDLTLGAARRVETGTTRGYATTARLLGGYWFNAGGNLMHGPNLRVTYQDIKVRAYSEQGIASTTMSFDQQQRKSLVTSLGWQVAGTFGALRPFARASWEHDSKADEREVGASVVGLNGHLRNGRHGGGSRGAQQPLRGGVARQSGKRPDLGVGGTEAGARKEMACVGIIERCLRARQRRQRHQRGHQCEDEADNPAHYA